MIGEQTFEFLKQIINNRKIDDVVTRAEIVNMLILKYKPSPKDPVNSTIRSGAVNPIFNELIIRGILERVGRGKYKILKQIPILLKYRVFKKTFKEIVSLNEN